jgi:integrase/recombinase XerD
MRSGVRISPSAPLKFYKTQHSQGFPAKAMELEGVFVCENPQKAAAKSRQLGKKVGNNSEGLLTVSQAAQSLGIPERTARLWCETGKLPAIHKPYGSKTRYLISTSILEVFKAQSGLADTPPSRKLKIRTHEQYITPWLSALSEGLLTGKPFSIHTKQGYQRYIETYFKRHKSLSLEGYKIELVDIPAPQFAKRRWLYEAVTSFAKYLIQQGALDEDFLKDIKQYRPKRHLPPKRHTITAEDMRRLIQSCQTVLERTLVILLASTGLRASELCGLQFQDLNLEGGFLIVRCGKGGKSRKVGLTADCREAIALYSQSEAPYRATRQVFLNVDGKPLERSGLYQRLERIGKLAGLKVSPHSLRLAFVTINANAGRPLQMLQMACGHSDIKTTMGYCRTSEQEMITAMQEW